MGGVEGKGTRGPGGDGATLSPAGREMGAPAVAASPDCRYGVSIIRDLIPQELGGSVDLAFASGGVCCKIKIPLEPARDASQGPSLADGPVASTPPPDNPPTQCPTNSTAYPVT